MMNNKELWKPICYTKGNYSVSNTGLVKNNITNKILKGSHVGKSKKRDRVPYSSHGLRVDGKRVFKLTHRIVASAFIPNKEGKPQINHKDKNVKNNNVSNLEWVTNKENTNHAHSRLIYQYKDGLLCNTWAGLTEIKETLNYNKGHICDACNHKRKAYGFRWTYLNKLEPMNV